MLLWSPFETTLREVQRKPGSLDCISNLYPAIRRRAGCSGHGGRGAGDAPALGQCLRGSSAGRQKELWHVGSTIFITDCAGLREGMTTYPAGVCHCAHVARRTTDKTACFGNALQEFQSESPHERRACPDSSHMFMGHPTSKNNHQPLCSALYV